MDPLHDMGVHEPSPWKWFVDPVQSGGPRTPGP